MLLKQTNQKYHDLLTVLVKLQGVAGNGKWLYNAGKNIQRLQEALKPLKEMSQPTDLTIEYDKQRNALLDKYADKGGDGKPIYLQSADGQPQIKVSKNVDKLEKKLKQLEEKYSHAINDKARIEADIAIFMATTQELELFQVRISDIPEGKIPMGFFPALEIMIDDSPDSKVVKIKAV